MTKTFEKRAFHYEQRYTNGTTYITPALQAESNKMRGEINKIGRSEQ
jgi:hypothetical protein